MQQAFKSAAHWHVNHLPVSYSNRHVIRHILEQVKSFKALPKAQRKAVYKVALEQHAKNQDLARAA